MRRPTHGGGSGVRGLRALLLVALGATALAGCGGGGPKTTTSAQRAIASSAPASGAPASTVPPRPPRPRTPPALAHLRRALERAFKHAGRSSGALVYDLKTGRVLFALRDRVRRPPASVEKLYTSVALLARLGPRARLHTTVLGVGHLGRGGAWHGSLFLHGGGDPTFGDGRFNRIWEQGYGPTATELTEQLRHHGIRRVTGKLIADSSMFDGRVGGPSSGFAPDIPDLGGELSALSYDHGATAGALSPGAFAARALARTLRAQHVAVKASPRAGLAPPHARKLASVTSPPLSVLLQLMDVPSDDLFAELLTKQLGFRFGRAGTTAAGARIIAQVAHSYGVHPRIVDGSGLSRANASSPAEVVALLDRIWHTAIGSTLTASLPAVGLSGTVRSLATGTVAQGRCIAKTGTLNNVTNLAGYCAARGRRELSFALFIDGPPNTRSTKLLGRMVAAIASY